MRDLRLGGSVEDADDVHERLAGGNGKRPPGTSAAATPITISNRWWLESSSASRRLRRQALRDFAAHRPGRDIPARSIVAVVWLDATSSTIGEGERWLTSVRQYLPWPV